MTTTDETRTWTLIRNAARTAGIFAVLAMLLTAAVGATTGAAQPDSPARETPDESSFVVVLAADGSARVTLSVAFDLATERERQAFDALRQNGTTQARRTAQFADRMRAVATASERTTGRTMSVDGPGISFATLNDTGLVALSVSWNGLAALEDDRLVLREPFASGFAPDRPFRVVGPDGYELGATSPTPTTQTGNTATWSVGTDFDHFEATFEPVQAGGAGMEGGESEVDGPGFGIGLGVVAVLAGTALLLFRYQRPVR